ncbi:unnamed protein product [Discosporangium mesarthrocarpum]
MKAVIAFAAFAMATELSGAHSHHPAVGLVEKAMLTIAKDEFDGHHSAFVAASNWQLDRLKNSNGVGPFLACAAYGEGAKTRLRLTEAFSKDNVVSLTNNRDHGACFIVLASEGKAREMLDNPASFGLSSAGAFPPALKLAPGLLSFGYGDTEEDKTNTNHAGLATTHGKGLALGNVLGLNVKVAPGHQSAIVDWRADWDSADLKLQPLNFWSDPDWLDDQGWNDAHPRGSARSKEWTRAAELVHNLSVAEGTTVGQSCGWDNVLLMQMDDDRVIMTAGLDHLLLPEETEWTPAIAKLEALGDKKEMKVACLMTLLSYLASRPEVVRISSQQKMKVLNAVATAVVESATITNKPITQAGLDGAGEIIQASRGCTIVDTGLDETSCFFADEDGVEVEHGYFYEEILESGGEILVLPGDFFPYDLSRRKIVQYIDLLQQDNSRSDLFYYTDFGAAIPLIPAEGYGDDVEDGHGTHVAGSAGGATLHNPVELSTCPTDEIPLCSGKCMGVDDTLGLASNGQFDLDTFCETYSCDGMFETCLGDDVGTTLAEHSGVATGAQLAIFDVSSDGDTIDAHVVGNGLWEAAEPTGAKVHSNSWGGDPNCEVDDQAVDIDEYLYENPEHIILVSAGNDGDLKNDPSHDTCTISSPAIAKNVLTIGASSSGPTRVTYTNMDGNIIESFFDDLADINVVAYFSSYGPSEDGRVKPELVAPGDQVFSASSDATDSHTCQLAAASGTSMSCPIAAGAAAIVRQYFIDESFYVNDLEERGMCGPDSVWKCEGFEPSGPTVKAVLINSANLMGGSSEPDNLRGFGRVQLDSGLMLDGEGGSAVYVTDSQWTSIYSSREDLYELDVEDADVELRATLAWYDPPASPLSSVQLQNDLDLTVVSPSGKEFLMWEFGVPDSRNTVERVIVPASSSEVGTWKIKVSAKSLSSDPQPYSLVVMGSISGGNVTEGDNTSGGVRRSKGFVGSGMQGQAVFTAAAVAIGTVLGLFASI